jgi:hypothetical protein
MVDDADGPWAGWAQARIRFAREVLPAGGVGAELGVYKGFFSRVLLDVLSPARLHLIDPWYLLGERWDERDGGESTVTALVEAVRRVGPELVSGQAVLHIGSDLDVLPTFPDGCLDWAYVDSVHTYEQASAELELLGVKVRPGGVIAGDDWSADPDHPFFGVCRAVREFVGRDGFELVYADRGSDCQWAVHRVV